jgi:NADH-quinone oxidoreductase subunit J
MTGTGEAILFWILGPLAVVGALGLIFARKAVHAAIAMAMTMIILGIFYLAQSADFLGVIQIFVYTGAVMMLFLFVVMLVGVDSSDSIVETLKGQRAATIVLTLGLAALLMGAVGRITIGDARADKLAQSNAATGNVSGVAELIFGRYVWVFEATSALLITAALAAMVLAHRERLGSRPDQRAWSERRIRSGENLAGLPVPGVYARHNAVDTPALLPDGTPSELSVSRVLTARDQVGSAAPWVEAEHDVEREIGDADWSPNALNDGDGAAARTDADPFEEDGR